MQVLREVHLKGIVLAERSCHLLSSYQKSSGKMTLRMKATCSEAEKQKNLKFLILGGNQKTTLDCLLLNYCCMKKVNTFVTYSLCLGLCSSQPNIIDVSFDTDQYTLSSIFQDFITSTCPLTQKYTMYQILSKNVKCKVLAIKINKYTFSS